MKTTSRIQYLVFIMLGVLALVLKRYYTGPLANLVINHGSNFSVSFAVYFIALMGFSSLPQTRLLSVIGSLLVVELFELTNGFGVMSNVYDPWDYLANALGIGLALGIDLMVNRSEEKKE
ncbi:MAG: hypothetical protein MUO54_08525 [Anaerolineales bacterium]|nr:hypothetical protein [Anaerolineales bacterium]